MKAIVDCNSFYCSCERVFRPELMRHPVVVLSNNDGCIISRTDEAKQLGVHMTGPYFLAKKLIEENNVAVFSSNYNLYGDMSRRVMDILKESAGERNVEVYSVDEAFLTIDNLSSQNLKIFAEGMRDKVQQWTGVQVSVGMARTKTLAKLANRIAKKNKTVSQCVSILDTDEMLIPALKQTPVGDLWGVGARYADKLNSLGLCTAWDLRNISEEWARIHLGGVVGVRLVKELRGEEAIMMKDELDTKKMIATTRMFGHTVTELKDLKEAVASYAGRAAEKLRRQKSAVNIISVFLVSHEKVDGPKFKHGPTVSAYNILHQPTALTPDLIKPAMILTEQLFEQGKKYKKAGVILSGLVPDSSIQGNLFSNERNSGRFLMDMVDNINFSMRDDVVKFAASGTKRDWKMRRDFQSPRYTTRWDELYRVS